MYGVQAKIQTGYVPNTILELHRYTNQLDLYAHSAFPVSSFKGIQI
jgi:hypothetical protein